jgi:hypothetical protein
MTPMTPVSVVRERMVKLKTLISKGNTTNISSAVETVFPNYLYTSVVQKMGFVRKNGDGTYKWHGELTDARIKKAMDYVRSMQRASYKKSTKPVHTIPSVKNDTERSSQESTLQQISIDLREIKSEFNVLKVVLYNLQNRPMR